MKKLIALIALVFVSFTSFAQLNVQTVQEYANYKTVYTVTYFGSSIGEIRYIGNYGYVLMGVTNNQFEKSMASIILGEDKESAIQSLKDLKSLYDNTEEGEFIVSGFNNKKTKILIYMSMGTKIIQITTDGIAGVSGIPGWFCQKEKHYNGAINAITEFQE